MVPSDPNPSSLSSLHARLEHGIHFRGVVIVRLPSAAFRLRRLNASQFTCSRNR